VATSFVNCVLDTRALDNGKSDEMLVCLGERSDLNEPIAISRSHRRRRRWRCERLALEQDVARSNVG
jgi:hypothetical protein